MAVPGQTSAPLVRQMPVGTSRGRAWRPLGHGFKEPALRREGADPHLPGASPSPATCDAMRRERVRQVFDGQVEQAGDAVERDMAPVDGAREDLDERP